MDKARLHFYSLLLIGSFHLSVLAAEDPKLMLETVADRMITIIDENKQQLETDPAFADRVVRAELLPIIDRQGLGRRVIVTRVWQDLSETEKVRFIDGFINLVIHTYAGGLAKYDGEQFEFGETSYHKSARTAYIKSTMASADISPVRIDYTLKKSQDNEQWRIVDVKIDGVSMVQTYRAQFKSLIKQEGFAAVLAKLENRKLDITVD